MWTNTDTKVTSTSYSSSGSFYAYPTVEEVNIRLGSAIAVANVVGTATGGTAYPDLLVGAPNASEAGSSYRYTGCVYVFEGTGVGAFSATATGYFLPAQRDHQWDPKRHELRLGVGHRRP